jgi:cobalamin biosynthesis protein CbiD
MEVMQWKVMIQKLTRMDVTVKPCNHQH